MIWHAFGCGFMICCVINSVFVQSVTSPEAKSIFIKLPSWRLYFYCMLGLGFCWCLLNTVTESRYNCIVQVYERTPQFSLSFLNRLFLLFLNFYYYLFILISSSLLYPPLPLLGVIPPVWGVFRRWHSDSDGCCPGSHLLPGGFVGWCSSGSYLWDPGRLHLTLHLPHACHRATLCLCVQLHGLPVSWDVPPLWHHGVSLVIDLVRDESAPSPKPKLFHFCFLVK